jgi:hypothetical protein
VILEQSILIGFNLVNSRIDAYRILKNKTIAHGVNFGAYLILVLILALFFKSWFLFIPAFFSRQITFDIPLNLRRGLKWDYVSLDRPPKALMDQIEVRIFGYNGRLSSVIYLILWVVSIIVL